MNMVRVKRLVLVLILLFVVAQFFQPKRSNPTVIPSRTLQAHVQVPAQDLLVLKRSCGDCHSSETVWPWYSHISPISWFVADDVNTGRSHINISDWEAQENPDEAAEHIGLICEETRKGEMPPSSYRLMHETSRLSPDEVNSLCAWSRSASKAASASAEPDKSEPAKGGPDKTEKAN